MSVTELIVAVLLAIIYGIGGFLIMLFVFRRFAVHNMDNSTLWTILFITGFCVPAVYGFYRSYQQDKKEKDRKRNGLRGL